MAHGSQLKTALKVAHFIARNRKVAFAAAAGVGALALKGAVEASKVIRR